MKQRNYQLFFNVTQTILFEPGCAIRGIKQDVWFNDECISNNLVWVKMNQTGLFDLLLRLFTCKLNPEYVYYYKF